MADSCSDAGAVTTSWLKQWFWLHWGAARWPLAAYWQQHPTHRQDLVRYLAKHKAQAAQAGIQMTYWRASNDGKGRFYAQGPAAQRLPKELRTLLFGRTHAELDIIGAFYEIIRRLANKLQESQEYHCLPTLQPIEQVRQQVEQELLGQRPQSHAAPVAKRLIHIAINAPVTTTVNYIIDQQYTHTPPLADLVKRAHQVAEAVCSYLSKQPNTCRLHHTARNRNFYHLEGIETDYITHVIQGLQQVHPQSSIVLLHDGLLVSPVPTQSTIARLHNEALHQLGLQCDDTPFLRISSLVDAYTQTIRQLPPTTPHNVQTLHTAIAAINLDHLRRASVAPQTQDATQYRLPQRQLRCILYRVERRSLVTSDLCGSGTGPGGL